MSPEPAARVYTVVLADDVAALRRLVKLAIEATGRFKVVAEAGTGVEAIARARESQPDLVLLDLSMPELDGLEALPRVLEAASKTHVIVLSGFNHVRMEPVAKRMGASAYLEKGLEPALLVQSILKVMEPNAPPVPVPALAPRAPPAAQPAPATSAPPTPPAVPSRPGPPMAPPLPPTPPAPGPSEPSAEPVEATRLGGSFRTLVIESDADLADRIAHGLAESRTARFICSHADSMHAASLRLEAHEADLVLVDPSGLGIDADDAFIEVLSRAPGVPVVALIAPGDVGLMARAMRLGIEDCLDPANLEADLLGRSLLFAVERRRAQEARRIVRDQQSELDRLRSMEALKTQFFNAAAHELGTPLTPIRLQVSLLRRMDGLEPVARRSLEILERNVDRLSRLNQDILDVARLQAGRLSIDKRPLDLKGLVREAMETFEPLAREHDIGLTATCSDGIIVNADPQRVVQVLYNLVSNALKFTARTGLVAIDVRSGSREVHVEVRDSGIGLRPEQIAKLFQPFSQVLGEAQPRGIGTGLGLYVSRGIIELHGGHIECRSAGPGHGCTFSFTLPRFDGPSAPNQLVRARPPQAAIASVD